MQKRKVYVYHLHFFDKEIEKQDYYFGSISAIYEVFSIKQVGIQASSLYNYKLDENKNPVYENRRCKIRKDIIISKSQSKNN